MTELLKLQTYCVECPNCGERICVDRYSPNQAKEALLLAIDQHCKTKHRER